MTTATADSPVSDHAPRHGRTRAFAEARVPVSFGRASTVAASALLTAIAASTSDRLFSPEFTPAWAVGFVAVSAVVALINRSQRLVLRVLAQIAVIALAVVVSVSAYEGDVPADVWRSMTRGLGEVVSARWPAPTSAIAAGGVAFVTATCAGLVVELAWTRRYSAILLVPPTLLLILTATLSSEAGTPGVVPIAMYAGVAAVTLRQSSLARAERRHGPPPDAHRRVSAVVASLVALAAFIPVAIGMGVSSDRWDLRRIREPQQQLEISVSPLSRLGEFAALGDGGPLLSIFPTPAAARVRFVALNRYNGLAWMPGTDFRPIGRILGEAGEVPTSDLELIIGAWDEPWVPYVGSPLGVDRDVRTDATRSGLLAGASLVPDDRIRLSVAQDDIELTDPRLRTATTSSDDEPLFENTVIPPELVEVATGLTESASGAAAKAEALAAFIRTAFQRQEALPAGHALAQLRLMLLDSRRGTGEQLVAGYALLAAAVKLPVRVAVGARLTTTGDGFSEVRREDVFAWPEIKLNGRWVFVDIEPGIEPKPGVGAGLKPAQPPEARAAPLDVDVSAGAPTRDDQAEVANSSTPGRSWWHWALLVLVSAVVVAFASFLIVVPLLKRRRNALRREAGDPADVIVGAFRSGIDHLVDLGFEPKPSDTDVEIARSGIARIAVVEHDYNRLARLSTTVTYSLVDPPIDATETAWELSDEGRRQVDRTLSRWQRARSRWSVRSLRRRW